MPSSVDALIISVAELIHGGIICTTACGSRMLKKICGNVRPMARPASICPFGMACSAPRVSSVICAAENIVSATAPAVFCCIWKPKNILSTALTK